MKTGNGSDSVQNQAGGKGGTEVTARKSPAKKAAKKAAANTQRPSGGDRGAFPPEILADLAVKLMGLNPDVLANLSRARSQLASSTLDANFADALKRAERLLLAASGKSDEEVHAYQLFPENGGLMSFEDIAKCFVEFEWDGMTAGNTVKKTIEELVIAADLAVQKEREKYDRLASVRLRYPGGVFQIVDRVRRHIRNMIGRTDLRVLFDDPKQASEMVGQFFFRLMEQKIPGDWERQLDEDYATAAGFESFIEYVCGGLTFEQFIGDPPHAWMDLDRLRCFVFFLEELGSQKISDYKRSKKDLESLMRLVRGRNDVSDETMSGLDDCLKELSQAKPDAQRVRARAMNVSLSLRTMWEHWYFSRLASVTELSKLISEFGDSRSELRSADQLPIVKVDEILGVLQSANELIRAADRPTDARAIRQRLEELQQCLKDAALMSATRVAASRFDGLIVDEINRVVGGLEKGLKVKPSTKRHARASLDALLQDLRPYSGTRKCRPYELFLFAAQNRIKVDKLVRSRSSLPPGSIPNPHYPLSLSILTSHRGVDTVMGLEESD